MPRAFFQTLLVLAMLCPCVERLVAQTGWSVRSAVDELTDVKSHYFLLASPNKVEDDFGTQRQALLGIRCTSNGSRSIVLMVDGIRMRSGSVALRWDSDPAYAVEWSENAPNLGVLTAPFDGIFDSLLIHGRLLIRFTTAAAATRDAKFAIPSLDGYADTLLSSCGVDLTERTRVVQAARAEAYAAILAHAPGLLVCPTPFGDPTYCGHPELRDADRLLNASYHDLVARMLDSTDMDVYAHAALARLLDSAATTPVQVTGPAAVRRFRQTQREWMLARDQRCRDDDVDGKPAWNMKCLWVATDERARTFVNTLLAIAAKH